MHHLRRTATVQFLTVDRPGGRVGSAGLILRASPDEPPEPVETRVAVRKGFLVVGESRA